SDASRCCATSRSGEIPSYGSTSSAGSRATSTPKKRRSFSSASAASSSGSMQTSGSFAARYRRANANPRAAPNSPRARSFRRACCTASTSPSTAVALPRAGSLAKACVSKAHDHLRAGARGGVRDLNVGAGKSNQVLLLSSEVVEAAPGRQRARDAEVGELHPSLPGDTADFDTRHQSLQRDQPAARNAPDQRVVLAAGERELHPVRQRAGDRAERQR